MPNANEFRKILTKYFQESEQLGQEDIVLTAGEVHRRVGGYPGGSHSMPTCCGAMRQLMQKGDKLLYAPPSGKGASLKIRYILPRTSAPQFTKPAPRPKVSVPNSRIEPESTTRIETTKGKIVCFIPCCGSKVPSGITLNNTEHLACLSKSVSDQVIEARQRGGFTFESDRPKTTALELYTGSPHRTFGPIKHDLYQAMQKGVLRLYIISAGYGVIDARESIYNYNEEMKGKTAEHWRNHGLQDRITEILMLEKPDRFFGYFAAKSHWSHASSKYRYFFTEGGKQAITKGLDVVQAGCFYRLDGSGVGAILDGLGRTFVDHFKGGFNPEYANNIETNYRQDGGVTIGFDRFR